jgi:pyruvate, water dikinase
MNLENAPENPQNKQHIESVLEELPDLRDRIVRAILVALHSRGIASMDEIHHKAREIVEGEKLQDQEPLDDNMQIAKRWGAAEKNLIQELAINIAAATLTPDEFDDLVNLTRKRDEARTLEEIANLSSVSFGLLAEKVKSFCSLPKGQTALTSQESISTRVALIKRFISDQLEFIGVAKHYLHIRDFDDLIDRIIGPPSSTGLIGGKAGGMLLGTQILQKSMLKDPDAPKMEVHNPESWYLRSDVIEYFIQHNGLQYLQDHKYQTLDHVRKDYSMIQNLIKNADVPQDIIESIVKLLEQVGTHPLIVRSSSLLEDRFGTAFAGKYRSVFLCNQGSLETRTTELIGAILEVYSSVFHPDPISYRIRHCLLDYTENMGVLIQKVVGRKVGRYFLPVWAGVGFSENPYRRNPRVKPEDGMARLVFGLGTRAVDRVASDFPRMIPLGIPALRPEVKTADIRRVSQKEVDVIDLEKQTFSSVPLSAVLEETAHLPGLSQVFSTVEHEMMRPIMGDRIIGATDNLIVTFDKFAKSSPYPAFLKWCLKTLSDAYGYPVDIEYACDGERFYLLQCRPQATRRTDQNISLPGDVLEKNRIFSSNRDVIPGRVKGIRHIVLIDPTDYNSLTSTQERVGVAKVVSQLNQALDQGTFILMGPGRWGSKDLRLGVRVGYADINNSSMLIEIARRQSDYLPEVSFGSHFFQDLVESDIQYLALYPDDDGAVFNTEFLHGSHNCLEDLLPESSGLSHVVKVIDVAAASGGRLLNVAMDGEQQQALAWLAPPE